MVKQHYCVQQITSFAQLQEARAQELFAAEHRTFCENLEAALRTNRIMMGPHAKHGGFGRKACGCPTQ